MTLQEKMQAIQHITCPICRYYAWHFGSMTPVRNPAAVLHHPSCPTIKPPPRDDLPR